MATYHGIEIPTAQLAELCHRYGVRELSIFGSAVRDDFRDDSDVDLLIEFEPDAGVGLIEYVQLQEELSRLIGRKVDLVRKTGLKPLIRDEVLSQAEVLYPDNRAVDGAVVSSPVRPQAASSLAAGGARRASPLHIKDGPPVGRAMRRAELYLRDIVEAVDAVDRFLRSRSREDFLADDLLRSAVLQKLTVVGEAAARLPRERRDQYPEIPWAAIIGFRNVVVHLYFGVDWDIVWEAATVHAPALRTSVARILADEFPPTVDH